MKLVSVWTPDIWISKARSVFNAVDWTILFVLVQKKVTCLLVRLCRAGFILNIKYYSRTGTLFSLVLSWLIIHFIESNLIVGQYHIFCSETLREKKMFVLNRFFILLVLFFKTCTLKKKQLHNYTKKKEDWFPTIKVYVSADNYAYVQISKPVQTSFMWCHLALIQMKQMLMMRWVNVVYRIRRPRARGALNNFVLFGCLEF